MSDRTERLKAKGICQRCGKARVYPDKTICLECMLHMRQVNHDRAAHAN